MNHLPTIKLLFSLTWIIVTVQMLQGQSFRASRMQDVLYLENGWVIRGWVMSSDDADSVFIETVGRNVFVFDRSEVKVQTEEPRPRRSGRKPYVPAPVPRGYTGYVQMGSLTGTDRWGATSTFELVTAHGYRFSHLATVLGGTGINLFPQGPMMPLFVEGRSQLREVGTSFVVHGKAGYGIPLTDFNSGGWGVIESYRAGGLLGEVGMGIRIPTPRKMAWLFSVGYRIQQAQEYIEYEWGEIIDRQISYRRIGINLGIEL